MTPADKLAPTNKLAMPVTEKSAAHPARSRAEINTIIGNKIILLQGMRGLANQTPHNSPTECC